MIKIREALKWAKRVQCTPRYNDEIHAAELLDTALKRIDEIEAKLVGMNIKIKSEWFSGNDDDALVYAITYNTAIEMVQEMMGFKGDKPESLSVYDRNNL